jgi:TonB family protein
MVSWTGGCQDGRASGSGVEIWRSAGKEVDRYEGAMRDGKFNGRGSITYESGSRYDGEWVDGKRSGHGVFAAVNGARYDGAWVDGKPSGHGASVETNGARYDGGWLDGKRTGHGVLVKTDGSRYDGEWVDNKASGHGVFVWINGDRYDGEWSNSKRTGHGVMVWANGDRYEGDWVADKQSGHGVFVAANGARFEDSWVDGKPLGHHPDFLHLITNPDWVKKPSAEDLARFWPADSRGMSGRALISCTVTSRGALDDCKLTSEEPPGHGFGAAALLMAPMFMMRPMTRDGVATSGAGVNIPIRFETGGFAVPTGPTVKVALTPPWGETPTAAAMATAFPASSVGRTPSGHVVLRCRLADKGGPERCDTMSEEPPGHGFANAARKLVKDFKIVSDWPATKGGERVSVDIPFDFRDPSRPATPVEVVDPQWIRTPDPNMAGKLFPEEAAKAGYKTGVATLVCEIAHGGALINCQVKSEAPENLGFGRAALAIAAVMVMNPWTPQGVPVDGAHIRLPIRVNLKDESPTPRPAQQR